MPAPERPAIAQPLHVEVSGEEERSRPAGHGQLAGGGEGRILDHPDRDLVDLERHLQLLGTEAPPADVAAAADPPVVGLSLEVAPEDA